MKHTLGELYNMKHRQEKSLQDNEYELVKATRKGGGKQKEAEEEMTELTETIEPTEKETKGGDF